MSDLTTRQTAQVLGVAPAILREWETRFGFPHSILALDGRRRFVEEEVVALRAALGQHLSVPQAVDAARSAVTRARRHGVRRIGGSAWNDGDGPFRQAAS